jgi:hypothetical protein
MSYLEFDIPLEVNINSEFKLTDLNNVPISQINETEYYLVPLVC